MTDFQGVWNLIAGITPIQQRREILDWYHLVENLYKVGGSLQRLTQVKTDLWHGRIESAVAALAACHAPLENFLSYLRKHHHRIPNARQLPSGDLHWVWSG